MGTHYETLQIPAEASRQKIRAAYFRLADIHHPDRGGDGSTFADVQTAYQTLSNPERRAAYDQTLAPPEDADRTTTDTPPRSGPQGGSPVDEDEVFIPDWLHELGPENIDEDSCSTVKVVPGLWDDLLRIVTAVALAAAAVGLGYQRLDSTTWWLWAWLALWAGAATWGCIAAARAQLGGKVAVGVIAAATPLLIEDTSTLAAAVWLLCFIGFGAWATLRSTRGFTAAKVRAHNATTVSQPPEAVAGLVLIPAVRIVEDPIRPGSRFIVTCGANVAVIGPPLGVLQEFKLRMAGATVRCWPLEVTADADHCLDEVGAWLLTNSDGWTVNRRVLAASTHTFWPK